MNKVPTGIEGLDQILSGGIPRGASIIIEGRPGTGKTTLCMQYLVNGALQGEAGMYITFEETPHRIHKHMQAYSWDIPSLERRQLLQMVCITPRLLLEQMQTPDSYLEQRIKELNCKRIVIDSITLYSGFESPDIETRQTLYQLMNVLSRNDATSLLIKEYHPQARVIDHENYLSDGIIRMDVSKQLGKYRKRTLEILKMRGSQYKEGEHIFRMLEEGIYVIPSLNMFEDITLTDHARSVISTGIPSLDHLLGGGFLEHSIFLLDTNSKANYSFFLTAIASSTLRNNGLLVMRPSIITSKKQLSELFQLHDISLDTMEERGEVAVIQGYSTNIGTPDTENVEDLRRMDNAEFEAYVTDILKTKIKQARIHKKHVFCLWDLHSIYTTRGKEFTIDFFAKAVIRTKEWGITYLFLSNVSEMVPDISSFLERSSNGVIRTWVDGNYQFLQLIKSPTGTISSPLIVENIPHRPYVRLV